MSVVKIFLMFNSTVIVTLFPVEARADEITRHFFTLESDTSGVHVLEAERVGGMCRISSV